MTRHLPILIVVLPLCGALLVPVTGLVAPRLARLIALLTLLLAHLCALGALQVALTRGPWRYALGGWEAPWGIEYVVDALSGAVAVLVSFVALTTAVYAGPHLAGRSRLGVASHQALHLLLTAGLLGIVVTGDVFNLYVFLEIAALSGYALLAGESGRGAVAAFRYLLVGTVAASLYLLGIGYLYALTGTLNMADLAARLALLPDSTAAALALALIVVGLAIKTALFPLHGWLPDAYAEAPAAAVAFVSSVASKVAAYVLIRFLFFVFDAGAAGRVLDLLGVAAAGAIVFGAVMALAQRDLRRMLAYSSVAHVGYVVLGLALGNAVALTGALLHAANHAVMKACLFMASGNLLRGAGPMPLTALAGLARRAPLTMAAFTVAALSMVGLPPFGGFFSKWYLVLGALEGGVPLAVAVIVGSSLLSAVYMFRIVESAYFREPATDTPVPVAGEGPTAALAPVLLMGAVVIGLGLFNQVLVEAVLAPAAESLVR